MRQKRAKTYKRVMALYIQTYHFRHPFQILVSDDLLTCPAAASLDIYKALSTSVQGEIKPMITQCCIEQLYSLGSSSSHITRIAKTFERRKCNHRDPIPSDQCLKETIGETNKHRYILASQSQPLLEWGEKIAGLPMIHFNSRGVIVLAPPSAKTMGDKEAMEKDRREEGEKLLDGVEEGENVIGGKAAVLVPVNKRKKAKEPNPLSMKRKRTAKAPQDPLGTEGSKSATVATGPAKSDGTVMKKRRREDNGDEDNDQAAASTRAPPGDTEEAQSADDAGRRKKKRKRRGKGAVAAAIAEIRAGGLGNGAEDLAGSGGEGSD